MIWTSYSAHVCRVWDTPAPDFADFARFIQALVDRFDADPVLSSTVQVFLDLGFIVDQFTRASQLDVTPHMPCVMFFLL